MSGSVTITATGPLTTAELVDARRFAGYPVYGDAANNQSTWFFFQAYGNFEFRLTNLTDTELTVVRTYLAQLTKLELSILGAADNLDTDVAAVWTRNKSEIRDREALFSSWRRRLCGFLGVPPGPDMVSQSGRIVV